MAGFIGAGKIYIDRDRKNQWIDIGNANKFAISETEVEIKERISKQPETYGQALDRVPIPKPAKITIEIDDLKVENLALALRGIVEEINESGNVTDESVQLRYGYYSKLQHRNVSSVVVTDSSGTTTYEEGVDYEVNKGLGLIKPIESGSIGDGDIVLVDYSYSTAGRIIRGSRQPEIECAIELDGINRVNQEPCIVTIYWAKLSPASEVDFLAEDFQNLTLEGTIITPPGKEQGYDVFVK